MSNALVDAIVMESGIKRAAAWERVRKSQTSRIDCDRLFSPKMPVGRKKNDVVAGFDISQLVKELGMTRAGIRNRIKKYMAGEITAGQVSMPKIRGRVASGEPPASFRRNRKLQKGTKKGEVYGNAEWRSLSDESRGSV